MGLFSGHLSTKSLMMLFHSLAQLLGGGVPIRRALSLVRANKGAIRTMLGGLGDRLEEGRTLEDALRLEGHILPPYVIDIIGAGERAGKLECVFTMLETHFEESLQLQRALWREITYPLCIIIAATIIIPFVKGYVIASMGAEGASFTVYALRYLTTWTLPFLVLAAIVLLARLGVFRPLTDRLTLDSPFLKAYTRRMALARFLWTLSILLDSAIPLPEAIGRAARATGNRRLERDFAPAIPQVARGAPFGAAIGPSHYLTPLMKEMFLVGERAGELPEMLRKAAGYNVKDAHHFAWIVVGLLEGVLILGIGIIILVSIARGA